MEKGQAPKILFIGYSDSWVIPNLITTKLPGGLVEELSVSRNIANSVPPYNPRRCRYTIAILKDRVQFLEVDNILLVYGHSNYRGLRTLYYPREKLAQFPGVEEWLLQGEELKRRFSHLSELERKRETELANLLQLERLRGYPFIKKRVEEGRLNLIG
ncbi:MAG: carbonic anhydrase [Campylobacterales bacterium]